MVLYDSVQPEVVRQQKRVVLSEVSALLALLRRNAKWSSGRSGQSGSLVGVARHTIFYMPECMRSVMLIDCATE